MDRLAEIARIRAITDPNERWEQINATQHDTQILAVDLRLLRGELATELRQSGLTMQEIADRFGITRGRVAQILKAQ